MLPKAKHLPVRDALRLNSTTTLKFITILAIIFTHYYTLVFHLFSISLFNY